jgi:transcriptional regulator with XRE-family HTH domain
MVQNTLKASTCLADNLKLLRGDMSQGDLAKKVGLSKQSISNYENERRFPKDDELAKLASFFRIEETDFFDPNLDKKIKTIKK